VSLPPGAREARPVAGGDINEAFAVVLRDGGQAFVKTRADAAPGEFAAEAAGLRWLAEPGALRTPRVLDVDDGYLALEWIEPGTLDADGEQELGRGLAMTHTAYAPGFGRFDPTWAHDEDEVTEDRAPGSRDGDAAGVTWLASLRLSNEPTADWPTFYAERRLRPLALQARDRGALQPAGVEAVERVCERMSQLTGPPEAPARLHGDLWQGNVLADAKGRPWLIDPSAYGGHREVDLAMLALFGSPSPRTLDGYQELAPLADGWRERVGLYQLLPLLVHALLFGGSYRAAAERMARRYT
jgi:fructosamine-3-kinase